MTAVHVRDVPETALETLRQRARRNHRSLQKELLHILVSAAREGPPPEFLPPLKLKLSKVGGSAPWRREDLYGDDGR